MHIIYREHAVEYLNSIYQFHQFCNSITLLKYNINTVKPVKSESYTTEKLFLNSSILIISFSLRPHIYILPKTETRYMYRFYFDMFYCICIKKFVFYQQLCTLVDLAAFQLMNLDGRNQFE